MKTDKATVTIPYDEFAKHQEQLKEIEWAREIKKKMDSGELMETNIVAQKIVILGEYALICQETQFGHSVPDFKQFVSKRGFGVEIEQLPGSQVRLYMLTEKK